MAEYLLYLLWALAKRGALVDVGDVAFLVDRDDSVVGGIDDGAVASFAFGQGVGFQLDRLRILILYDENKIPVISNKHLPVTGERRRLSGFPMSATCRVIARESAGGGQARPLAGTSRSG